MSRHRVEKITFTNIGTQNSGLWRAGLTHHLLFFLTWWSAHIHVTIQHVYRNVGVIRMKRAHFNVSNRKQLDRPRHSEHTSDVFISSSVTLRSHDSWTSTSIHSMWFYVFPGFYNKLKMCVETTGSCLYDEDDRNNSIKSAVFLLRLLVYRFIYTSWTVFTCTCTHRLLSQHVYQWTLPVFVFR